MIFYFCVLFIFFVVEEIKKTMHKKSYSKIQQIHKNAVKSDLISLKISIWKILRNKLTKLLEQLIWRSEEFFVSIFSIGLTEN